MTGIGSSSSSSCGACKFLRRRCASECIFAPYFSYEQAAVHFAAVHKVFGASNVSKLLLHLPLQWRSEAAVTISYEAQARIRDPIYGCVAQIFALQQQVATLKEEIETFGNQMGNLITFEHFPYEMRETFDQVGDDYDYLAFCRNNSIIDHNINQESFENDIDDQQINLLVFPQSTADNNYDQNLMMMSTTDQQINPPLMNERKEEDTTNIHHSNSNILETIFQQLGKTGYLQNLWTQTNLDFI